MQGPSADRGYAVFLGLDVGKGEHHATALGPDGRRVYDKPLRACRTQRRTDSLPTP